MGHEDFVVDELRKASATERAMLAALCNGAQLVLRGDTWEAYRELDGKVRPLGLRLSRDKLRAIGLVIDGITVEVASKPVYAWLPSRYRDCLRDRLTQSMPTQHLVVEQAEHRSDIPAENPRSCERQTA